MFSASLGVVGGSPFFARQQADGAFARSAQAPDRVSPGVINHEKAGVSVLFFDGSVRFLTDVEEEAALKMLE